jgi:hypothetical protein
MISQNEMKKLAKAYWKADFDYTNFSYYSSTCGYHGAELRSRLGQGKPATWRSAVSRLNKAREAIKDAGGQPRKMGNAIWGDGEKVYVVNGCSEEVHVGKWVDGKFDELL